MGWSSCLLVGDPALLSRVFPGWKPPLRPPVRERGIDPFTRKPIRVLKEVADYDEGETVPYQCDWKRLNALDPLRISQTFDPEDLETLAKALRVRGKPYRRALSEPWGSETVVLELTEPFVEALSSITPAQEVAPEELTRIVDAVRKIAGEAIAGKAFVYLINQV